MNKVELVDLRRDFHRHPETAFQEHRTAEIIADELKALGLDVSTGIAGTGVIGSLVRGAGPRGRKIRCVPRSHNGSLRYL